MSDRGPWMQTFTGRAFYPLDPRPEDVCIEDVAHALAMQCRYNGHSIPFYSVAEHSVIVSYNVKFEHAREGLMHDAAEAYLGDMIRPLKATPLGELFAVYERRVEAVIAERFALWWTAEATADVSEIDRRILCDELAHVMAAPPQPWWHGSEIGLGSFPSGEPPQVAERDFLDRFRYLFGADAAR